MFTFLFTITRGSHFFDVEINAKDENEAEGKLRQLLNPYDSFVIKKVTPFITPID